jgi:hypothetical protein
MQTENDAETINKFIGFTLPIVTGIVRRILESFGWQVTQKGQGLDIIFVVKADSKEIEFYMHNLILEIATIDRDEEPLRFDERLRDFDFFINKTITLIESKLRVLNPLLCEDDLDAAIGRITQNAKGYHRIRIYKFDPQQPV